MSRRGRPAPSPLSVALHWLLAGVIVVAVTVGMFYAGRASAADLAPAALADFPVGTSVSVLALLVSITALILARRDKQSEAQKNALARIEQTLGTRIESIERLGNERHGTNVESLNQIQQNMAKVNEALRHIPTARDLDGLQHAIGSLGNVVSELKGSQEANNRMVDRMNQFLMERGT